MKIVLNSEDILNIIKSHLRETYNFEVDLNNFGYDQYNELVAEATLKGIAKDERKVKEGFTKPPIVKAHALKPTITRKCCSTCKNSGSYSYGGNGPNCPECGGS